MMNRVIIKYFVALVALLLPLAAGAQSDKKAVAEGLKYVIKNHPAKQTKLFVEKLSKKFKKDPEMMTEIASAFFYNAWDSATAHHYINRAIDIDEKYAKAYALAGDMELRYAEVDTAAALKWYLDGTKEGIKDPVCYSKYATLAAITDLKKAENKLGELAKADTACPVDLYRARMYSSIAILVRGNDQEAVMNKKLYPHLAENFQTNFKKAMDSYRNVDTKHFERNDYVWFIQACLANGQFATIVDTICPAGLKRFPRDAFFNRQGFNYARQTGDKYQFKLAKPWYEKALVYADSLFNNSDSAKITAVDMYNVAYTYSKKKDYTKAVEAAQALLEFPDADEDDKSGAMKMLIDAYTASYEYDKAIVAIKEYNAQRETNGMLTYKDLERLAGIYKEQVKEMATETEKFAKYKEIIPIYEEMAEKFDNVEAKCHAYYMINRYHGFLDEDMERDLALPSAIKQVELLTSRPEYVSEYKEYLVVAYGYLGAYYFLNKKKYKIAGEYAVKALELDESDRRANAVYNALPKNIQRQLKRK